MDQFPENASFAEALSSRYTEIHSPTEVRKSKACPAATARTHQIQGQESASYHHTALEPASAAEGGKVCERDVQATQVEYNEGRGLRRENEGKTDIQRSRVTKEQV